MGTGVYIIISGTEGVRIINLAWRDNNHSENSPGHERESAKSFVGVY